MSPYSAADFFILFLHVCLLVCLCLTLQPCLTMSQSAVADLWLPNLGADSSKIFLFQWTDRMSSLVIKYPHWTSIMATIFGDVQYSQNGTVTNPWSGLRCRLPSRVWRSRTGCSTRECLRNLWIMAATSSLNNKALWMPWKCHSNAMKRSKMLLITLYPAFS